MDSDMASMRRSISSGEACCYEIMGLPRDCTPAQIRTKYHALARELHPDRRAAVKRELKSEEDMRFVVVKGAYEVLSDPTLRALFRAAGAELVAGKTPPKVVIVEFVDVAKAFFPEGKEPKFVNAVLDHMAREAQPDAFA